MSFLNSICHLLGKRFKVVFQALGFWILLSGCASAPKPFVKKVEPFQPSNYSVSRTHSRLTWCVWPSSYLRLIVN